MQLPLTLTALGSAVVCLSPLTTTDDATFDPPVRISADGAPIDLVSETGHSGPLLRDHDGDGKLDLLVSTFRGVINVYRNVGSNAEPEYEHAGHIGLANDASTALKFHNW